MICVEFKNYYKIPWSARCVLHYEIDDWLNENDIIYERKPDWVNMGEVFKMGEIDATAFRLRFGI